MAAVMSMPSSAITWTATGVISSAGPACGQHFVLASDGCGSAQTTYDGLLVRPQRELGAEPEQRPVGDAGVVRPGISRRRRSACRRALAGLGPRVLEQLIAHRAEVAATVRDLGPGRGRAGPGGAASWRRRP
jgi:hypothetical protein